jgi:hypothetical protein
VIITAINTTAHICAEISKIKRIINFIAALYMTCHHNTMLIGAQQFN